MHTAQLLGQLKNKVTSKLTSKQTNKVTSSLLELLVAAKKGIVFPFRSNSFLGVICKVDVAFEASSSHKALFI